MAPTDHQNSDAYLDRYLPNLPPERREEARIAIIAFARVLVRAGEKVRTLKHVPDSTEQKEGASITSLL